MKIRVILADDHRIVREGLRALLQAEHDIEVVAMCGDGRETVASVKQHVPDVVLMDIQMPDVDGLEATLRWRAFEEDLGGESHLPIIADPSHATGRRELVTPVGLSAIAAGSRGSIGRCSKISRGRRWSWFRRCWTPAV